MSFRSAKAEASLRLYSLPRRELQALCKQYGIPANKTNVKMADALSACIPKTNGMDELNEQENERGSLKRSASGGTEVENAKSKAWGSGSSLGVSKTTPMKVKLERKTGLPETSLASLILNGKKKSSPVKLNLVADMDEASFPKPNTTPLKRGIKRTERPMQTVQEEKVVPALPAGPAFTRAAAAALHEGKSINSPKTGAPTPRKRTAEIAAVVTRRGGDALPPVSFSDLLSTPGKSMVQGPEIIQLNTSGKTAKKMKSRLGARTSPKEEETTRPVSRGRRVAFADEVELQKSEPRASPIASDQANQDEPETETIELSYAEIEFKNTPLHRELLGSRRSSPVDEEHDVAAAFSEAEVREEELESSVKVGFEFRDLALHKELFGPKNVTITSYSPSEFQGANAIDFEASELEHSNSPFTTSPLVLDYSDMALGQEHTVLSSIREDAGEESDRKVDKADDPSQDRLPQGRDLNPLLDDMACDDLTEMDVPAHSPGSPLKESRTEPIPTFEQEPTGISPGTDEPLVIQEEVIEQQESDGQIADALADGKTDSACFEVSQVSSTPLPEERQKDYSCSPFEESQTEPVPTFEQEPTAMSPSTDDPPVIQEEGIQQQESDSQIADALVDGKTDSACFEVAQVSSTPLLDERHKDHSCSTPVVQRFSQELIDKDETRASSSAEEVITSSSKLVRPGPSAAEYLATPSTKSQSSTDSPLARAVTPLTKIQSNIDSTLAKATSILEKLAAWRADAEKKMKEGYWEPKFTSVVETAPPAAVFKTPIAKPAALVDRDLPSAKKARFTPKTTSGPENSIIVCEDVDIGSKEEAPRITTTRSSDESRGSSEVSDKENLGEKSIGDKNDRKLGVFGKEKKKGKKFEVLKDRPKNVTDHTVTGNIRPEDMSLRKLRAQVKEKVRQLETSKVPAQRSWN